MKNNYRRVIVRGGIEAHPFVRTRVGVLVPAKLAACVGKTGTNGLPMSEFGREEAILISHIGTQKHSTVLNSLSSTSEPRQCPK